MELIIREELDHGLKLFPENAYYSIWGFMVVDLELKNAELMIYAIIYSYFRNGDTFTGSRKYLAEWTGYSLTSVDTGLKNLIRMGLVSKGVTYVRGRRIPAYAIVPSALPPIPMHLGILNMCREEEKKAVRT